MKVAFSIFPVIVSLCLMSDEFSDDRLEPPDAEQLGAIAQALFHVVLKRSDSDTSLYHLLTKERVVLPDEEGGYDLRMVAGIFSLCKSDGIIVSKIDDVMKQEIKVNYIQRVVQVLSPVNDTVDLDASAFAVESQYLPMRVKGQQYRLKIYRTNWSSVQLWWESRLFGSLWKVALPNFFRNLRGTHWQTWKVWVEKYMPAHMCLRGVVAPIGETWSHLDTFPELCFSSVGLIVVSLSRMARARPVSSRSDMEDFLDALFSKMFKDNDVELALCLFTKDLFLPNTSPARPDCVVPIDAGRVFHKEMIGRLGSSQYDAFVAVAKRITSNYQLSGDSMSITDFCATVMQWDNMSIATQVIGQIGALMDLILPSLDVTPNPLDAPEDEPAVPKGSRIDVKLADTLAMGRGASSTTDEHVVATAQHMRSWRLLLPESKRRKIDPAGVDASILLRYTQVQECYYRQVRFPTFCTDGARVATKDVQYIATGGRVDARYRVAWQVMAP